MERESESSPLLPQDGGDIPNNSKINWPKVFLISIGIGIGLFTAIAVQQAIKGKFKIFL